MATKFSPKLRISSALISSAIFMVGCATNATSYNTIKPYYRTQGASAVVSAQAYYEQGKRHFAEKRYGLALNAFQAELSLNSKSIDAMNGIAACYDKMNRYDLAVSYYYKALKIVPESPRILSNLGYSFLLQGRDAEAIKVLNLALQKDPDNEFIKRNLVLAKSHGWDIDTHRQAPENRVAKAGDPAVTEALPAAVTTAQESSKIASSKVNPGIDTSNGNVQRSESLVVKQGSPVSSQKTVAVTTNTVTDRGQLPANEISNTISEPVKAAVATSSMGMAEKLDTKANAVSEMPDDSDLMPSIDIVSIESDRNVSEVEKATVISETSQEGALSIADSGLLPAIDIIIEAAEENQIQAQVAEPDTPESVQQASGISTINVDQALADTSVITVDGVQSASIQSNREYTIEVSNGNGWDGMARLLGSHLKSKGERVVRLTNARTFDYANTVIYYNTGKRGQAQHLASQLPLDVQLEQTAANRKDIDVRVVLGQDIVAHAPQVRSTLYAWNLDKGVVPASAKVEISNGNGRNGMARLLRSVMVRRGDAIRRVTNADNFSHEQTVIFYSKGRREDAEQLAAKLPLQPLLKETSNNRDDIDLRVVLGKDFLGYEVAMREFMDTNA